MSYADIQIQRCLEHIAASLEKIQKDLRSIAESTNQFSKEVEAFKTGTEQANVVDRIEQIKRLHDSGLRGGQISELLDLDFWLVTDVIRRYEEDDDEQKAH